MVVEKGAGQKKKPHAPIESKGKAKGKLKSLMGVLGLKNRAKTGVS
jgi:hypothetical protein